MNGMLINRQNTGKNYCLAVLACVLIAVVPCVARAQELRFSNHREVSVPEYAVLRIGPFYSSVTLSQSVGYRYTKGDGSGIDFMFENQRGVFLKDGSDFPMITTLDVRNYLLISRTMDLDFSLQASYEHYPLKTQEDEFILGQQGIVGNLSTEFSLSPYVKGKAYDDIIYRTDYIDTRGLSDRYGGQIYKYFQNTAGMNLDWLMAKDQNLGLNLSRADMLPRDDKYMDQQSISYSEALTYQQMINPLVMAGASATFSQYSYTAATNNRPDTSFQTYSVFSTVKLTERTVGSASIGYSKASLPSSFNETTNSTIDNGSMVGSLSIETELSRSLKHRLEYSRSMTAGFNSPYMLSDTVGYHLNWTSDELITAGLFSQYSKVSTGDARYGEYTDWNSGVNVALPVTSIVTLTFDTTYSIRENNNISDSLMTDVEMRNNYNTWTSRIGTSFAITREVVFSTYLQHIERSSDYSQLAYSRDVFVAMFTYTHRF